jgi:hypothetical protein
LEPTYIYDGVENGWREKMIDLPDFQTIWWENIPILVDKYELNTGTFF